MRIRVLSLASLSWLRIWHCRELWNRLQKKRLRSDAWTVVWARSCSSNWTCSLGTSHAAKKKKKKKRVPSLALILNSVQINNAIVEVSQLKRWEQKGPSKAGALPVSALTHRMSFWLSLTELKCHSSELVIPVLALTCQLPPFPYHNPVLTPFPPQL